MSSQSELIRDRLRKLREYMRENGLDAVMVPTDDYHRSEYVGEYFKERKYITGFTGSAGTALIMDKEAGLWTDGRYFLQARQELEGTGITLYRSGQKDVPKIEEYLQAHMKSRQTLAYDGRCVGAKYAGRLKSLLIPKDIMFREDLDPVGAVWEDRPPLSAEPAWELDIRWCGCSRTDKLARIRKEMEKRMADIFVLTTLEDIAWLLNIRGGDVHCNPVLLSYLVIRKDKVLLFANSGAVRDELRDSLRQDGVELYPYDQFYDYLSDLKTGEKAIRPVLRVLLSKEMVNSRVLGCLTRPGIFLLDSPNPTLEARAVKNETEAEHMRMAHIRDGVAVTRFLYWLKHRIGKEKITELSAAQKLHSFREEQENFLQDSFDPILAYGPHGAKPHYFPTPETDAELRPEGLLVADTGGHYLEGTTDITRTVVLGKATEEEKQYFTAVLRGHLALAAAVFKKGCSGVSLDILARQPLWEMGADYNHGTGHGVGFLLNVHEGPQRISYQTDDEHVPAKLKPGMITSDEPGYYMDGKFGIRHENLLLCKKSHETPDGEFYCFEPLTLVPFDLDGIDPARLTPREKELLNSYHRKVYETIAPRLPEEEAAWLQEATAPVGGA